MNAESCPLAEHAAQRPSACAIDSPTKRWTFAELAAHVSAVAASLSARGISEGTCVAFCAEGTFDNVILLLALWRVGAVPVPLSARLPSPALMAQREHLGAHVFLNATAVTQLANCSSSQSGRRLFPRWNPQRTASVLFTSGSTGEPKAVAHSWANHYYSAVGAQHNCPLQPDDRWLLSLPLWHVSGLAIVVRSLIAGATLTLVDGQAGALDFILARGITHVSCVATQLHRWIARSKNVSPPSHLKAVLVGGGPVSVALISEATALRVPLLITYGLTEMASQVTTTAPNATRDELATVGSLLSHRELRLSLDGEILVRGETLAQGYWNRGVLSRLTDEDGWFHTGDLGKVDEHQRLRVTGRRDNMFVTAGENVHPERIEAILLEHEAIAQAIVVARADHELGARPVAFVIPAHDHSTIDPDVLRAHCRKYLPGFMVPIEYRPWPANVAAADGKTSRRTLAALV